MIIRGYLIKKVGNKKICDKCGGLIGGVNKKTLDQVRGSLTKRKRMFGLLDLNRFTTFTAVWKRSR